jgi:hypothetical protein
MKKFILFSLLIILSQVIKAQQPFFFKEAFSTAVADTIVYPVHGSFKIDESAYGSYKNLQLWVFDAREKEIYYTVQSIPTREEYADLAEKMIDKTYALFMMNHGHILSDKCITDLEGLE